MGKLFKVAAVMVIAGVLLGGVGTGVAIAEYTSLEYTGRHMLGRERLESFDIPVSLEEGEKVEIEDYYQIKEITYVESMPENTIRYIAKYNPDMISIRPRYDKVELPEDGDELDKTRDIIHSVQMNYYRIGNELDVLMKHKEQILTDLKQGKIGTYEIQTLELLEIQMNPQMKAFVSLGF